MKPDISHQQIEMKLLLPVLKELLADGKTIRMTVTGNSMLPLLRDRQDSVLLTAPQNPAPYDVVLFVRDTGEAVLHRIIKKRPEGFILLGDNQLVPEGPIAPDQIVARAAGFYRGEHSILCTALWYRLYSFVWSRAGRLRKGLLPVAIGCGRLLKRLKGWE